MRVAEAMLLLLAARFLVRFVPLRFWRPSLWHSPRLGTNPVEVDWPTVRAVGRAVNRAAEHLPIAMVCLPRAITAQWMLARRGLCPHLLIGVVPPQTAEPRQSQRLLHAWVEVEGRIVVGDSARHFCRPAFALGGNLMARTR
ncbi:MAG: lasso peptide biosynthesis B2 protein [Rhizobiales bacterium]|nr:lasso peptide biosynthesis B2 protein [Hyphomicrobiales bacterium]